MRRSTEAGYSTGRTTKGESASTHPTAARVLMGLIAITCWLGADAAMAQPADPAAVSLRVLLYSGRPDPMLELEEDAEVLEILRDLEASGQRDESFADSSVIPAILGYKGVLITNPSGGSGLPERIAAYNGHIELRNGETVTVLFDEGRAVETLLLRLAVDAGLVDGRLLEEAGLGDKGSPAPEER